MCNHAEEKIMQSVCVGMPFEGEMVGVNVTENGHQEKASWKEIIKVAI